MPGGLLVARAGEVEPVCLVLVRAVFNTIYNPRGGEKHTYVKVVHFLYLDSLTL